MPRLKLYQIVDPINRVEHDALAGDRVPSDLCEVRAFATGERRKVQPGEWAILPGERRAKRFPSGTPFSARICALAALDADGRIVRTWGAKQKINLLDPGMDFHPVGDRETGLLLDGLLLLPDAGPARLAAEGLRIASGGLRAAGWMETSAALDRVLDATRRP